MANSSCAPIVGIDMHWPLHIGQQMMPQNCRQKNEKSLEVVLNAPSIHTVIFSFFGNYTSTKLGFAAGLNHVDFATFKLSRSGHDASSENKVYLFYLGLENAVRLLEQKGKSIIIVIDIPELPFFPRDCIKRSTLFRSDEACKLQKSIALEVQKDLREILNRLVTAHPKVRLYDSFNLLCDKDICNFENDKMLFYRDSDHLSLRGSTFFAKDFLKWLANFRMKCNFE